MKLLRRCCIVVVALLLFGSSLVCIPRAEGATPMHVLILNSYHEGYSWTDGEVDGIRSALTTYQQPLQLSVEYLDWLRFDTEENLEHIEALLTYRYSGARPDVLIVTDQPALDFALDHRATVFSGVPVVFCGIDDHASLALQDASGVTGVTEEVDPAATLTIALRLHTSISAVYVVVDRTDAGTAARQTIEAMVSQFADRVAFVFSPDIEVSALFDEVGRLSKGTLILAAPFTRDRAGLFIDTPEFITELTSHTQLPVYGIYEEGLGHGIVGGILTSSTLEGQKAGQLAVRILNGEPADTIPIVTSQSTRAAFDWIRLQKYGIPVSRLPVGATVVNQPLSIFDTNRQFVLTTLAVLLSLLMMLALLGFNTMRRQRAEAQLQRLATAVEQAAEGMAVTDPQWIVSYMNPAFEAMTGCPHTEAPGKDMRDILGRSAVGALEAEARSRLVTEGVWKGMFTSSRSDGTPVELELTITPVRIDDSLTNYTFIGRDVTAESTLEDQLRQSQKLEAIGRLAGGVAHDFNNILTGILGYANMLEPDAEHGSTMQEGLRVIQQAAERAAELTKQLLSFARRGKRQVTSVDLNATVLEVVSLLTRAVNKNITLAEHFGADQATVVGDPGQLQQVVLNLAINARDAMPNGGTITFRTRRTNLDAEEVMAHPGAAPGDYVALSVSDTGVGIERKNLRRIFEPFFTTKDEDKGTGMGLAMVYGIVKGHDGFVDVHSELKRGTTFTVYVPATDTPPVPVPAARHMEQGHGRILLVDDEEVVRKLAREMLRRSGYDVETAASTDEAVAWYQAHPEGADLVIIDMVMPGIDGRDCFHKLKAIDRRVRAILSTGYGLDGHAQDALDEGMVGYVQKPYHLQDLVTAVADALAEKPPA
jgi:two-component system cell cycle sensor histidine kinase/response regulator CckA